MRNVLGRRWMVGAPSAAAVAVMALIGGGAAASEAGTATVAAGAAPAGPVAAGLCAAHRGGTGHTLPAAAVGPVSRILGRGQQAYRMTRAEGDLAARNAAQLLAARFGPTGPLLRSGPVAVRMRLAGYGYGARLSAVRPAVPVARANQVIYHDGPLTQWYANGPAGLEQGFTLAAPPAHEPSPAGPEPLTLALAVSGGARARLTAGGAVFSEAGRSLAYRDLVVSDARGRRLRAWLTLAPGRVLLHADVAGARYPVTIDPVFQQLAELTASDGASGDTLGNSVAVSGSTVVLGTPSATVGGSAFAGAVYVFTEPGGGWANETQAAKLTASDAAAGDNLGYSVAIDGATIVAGAYDAGSVTQGAAYVFTEPGGGWADETQTAELTASDGTTGDALGYSVGISGNTVVAGAVNATVDSHTLQGAAYVFTEPGGGWADETQAAKLTASDGAPGTQFGQSVAISGATVVAGAPYTTVGPNTSQGAAYVFTEPGGGWADETQSAKLTASDGFTSDLLGSSVAISGSTVVAGAPDARVDCRPVQGAAYVFTEPGGGWADETQAAKLTASDGATGDALGYSVGISGNTVVAGAPFAMVGSNSGQGAAYVFTEPGGGWADETEAAKLTASGGAAGDEFGYAVGVSGGTAVAGAPDTTVGSNSGQGTGYVFGAPVAPPPPPAGYRLSGFHAPRAGSKWRAGAVIPVSTSVDYRNGTPVPGWFAAELAASCEVTVRASGAQRLPSRCLRWDPVTQRLAFRWPTGTRHAGKLVLTLRLAYLTPQTLSEPITITPRHHHHPHPHRHHRLRRNRTRDHGHSWAAKTARDHAGQRAAAPLVSGGSRGGLWPRLR